MQCTDVVSQALSEAACRVRALRDLTASDFRRELPAEDFAAYVWEIAARTAMFLAVAQEHGEAP